MPKIKWRKSFFDRLVLGLANSKLHKVVLIQDFKKSVLLCWYEAEGGYFLFNLIFSLKYSKKLNHQTLTPETQ